MASDCHLKLDGIVGESTHAQHAGEIEVMAWSWGVSRPNPMAGGGAGSGGIGRAQPGELHFTHAYDKASPILAKKCAQGVHIPTAVATVRRAGANQSDFMRVTMREVLVLSCTPSVSAAGDAFESVSLAYKTIEFAYRAQNPNGSLGDEVKFGWNIATGEVT